MAATPHLTVKSELDGTVAEWISTGFVITLQLRSRILPLVEDYTPAIGDGMDSIKLNDLGLPSWSDISPSTGQVATEHQASLEQQTLNLDRYKGLDFSVQDLVTIQSAVNFAAKTIQDALVAGAVQLDNDLIAECFESGSGRAEHATHLTVGGSGANNIGSSFDASVFSEIQERMDNADIPEDERYCILPPSLMREVASSDLLEKINESGNSEALRRGVVGVLKDFTLVKFNSPNLKNQGASSDSNAAVFFHRAGLGFAVQRGISMERNRNIRTRSDEYGMSVLYGVIAPKRGRLIYTVTES